MRLPSLPSLLSVVVVASLTTTAVTGTRKTRKPDAPADPCAGLGSDVGTFSTMEQVQDCLSSFNVSSADMLETVTNIKKMLDFIPLISTLDSLPNSGITTAFEFNTRILNLLASLNDNHMKYTPECYNGLFNFVQPWHVAATYPKDSPRPTLKLRGTHLKKSMQKDAFALWKDSLGGKNVLDFDGFEVVKVDGVDAVDHVQAYADKYSGYGKEPDSRFNNVLMFSYYSLGKYILKPGAYYSTTFLGSDAEPDRKYTLKSPDGKTFELSVPWLAWNTAKFTSTDKLRAKCEGATNDDGGDDGGDGGDGNDGGDASDAQIDSGSDLVDMIGGCEGLPSIDAAKVNSMVNSRLSIMQRRADPASGFDINQPLYQDLHNAFYILKDGITGVWVLSTFTIKGNVFDFYESWVANVTTGLIGIQQRGATKLIVDNSGNKGGIGCVSRVFADYLLPGTKPLTLSFRATQGMQALWKTSFFGKDLSRLLSIPDGTDLRDVKNLTRAGWTQPFSGTFVTKCVSTNGTVKYPALVRQYSPNDIAFVSNGNCGSACSLMVRALRDTWNVPAYVYGGATKQPFTPTSYEGGAVTTLKDLTASSVQTDSLTPAELDVLPKKFRNKAGYKVAIMQAFSVNGKAGLDVPAEWTRSVADGWLDVEDPSNVETIWNAVADRMKMSNIGSRNVKIASGAKKLGWGIGAGLVALMGWLVHVSIYLSYPIY
ncbi:hypothetical protein HDU97_005301 [Phlyctochytrium planicorne]|nr:hypothetical protein HDU97_005301 [Phlyctochytrium planicorne]